MAQRNPMNERYQGDGPGGQTRKSAARAKPATEAASSVHIRKKPTTDAEKRAARKAREKEQERKAAERARRKSDREKAAAEAAATADGAGLSGDSGKAVSRSGAAANQPERPQGFLQKLLAPSPNMPSSLEYKKWRRVYWVLIGIGVVCVAISFVSQTYLASISPLAWMIVLGGAYATIIAAFIVDFRKVRPLVKAHQKQGTGNKTPKQLKHEQEAKERAEALEAARKAARDAKRLSRRRKSGEDDAATAVAVPGEAAATKKLGKKGGTIVPGDE